MPEQSHDNMRSSQMRWKKKLSRHVHQTHTTQHTCVYLFFLHFTANANHDTRNPSRRVIQAILCLSKILLPPPSKNPHVAPPDNNRMDNKTRKKKCQQPATITIPEIAGYQTNERTKKIFVYIFFGDINS